MRLRSKAAHLSKRVNPGVGSSRAVQNDVLLSQPAQHVNDFALNCRLVRLNLPAMEIRAVVRDGELEIAHAQPRTTHQGEVRTKRLPGFTATLPSRQSGQSSSS